MITWWNIFNVWPKTILLLQVWPRDAKRLDAPARLNQVVWSWVTQPNWATVSSSNKWQQRQSHLRAALRKRPLQPRVRLFMFNNGFLGEEGRFAVFANFCGVNTPPPKKMFSSCKHDVTGHQTRRGVRNRVLRAERSQFQHTTYSIDLWVTAPTFLPLHTHSHISPKPGSLFSSLCVSHADS